MIRVLIVDDQSLICQGLKTMLELQPDLQVVGIGSNGEMAIEQVAVLQPDLVLMDVRMPLMDGRAATRIICERFPNVKVLVLSTFDDDQYIAESIRAGAKGYLLKDMPADELVLAIRLACQGYAQLAPGLLEKLMKNPLGITKPTASTELEKLTKREQQVLQWIASGATNREIAEQLVVTEGTVKTHVTHLLSRLDCRNRAQLAIVANSIFGTN
ncbi:MAG: response regulator transcription factor [Nostoc sp. DedSLP03]|uniref:response regulator transcription factor n=1 Tax=Nostoc sp. DedSLP03 TaxID=3075400 RepID=UPI002AD2A6A8|nr:response regulator transcription factor [Nostoc sp. DedSLP03]MDZ7969729.1 response regulator transcription factor [Nostoc sp. DedSLP03]